MNPSLMTCLVPVLVVGVARLISLVVVAVVVVAAVHGCLYL